VLRDRSPIEALLVYATFFAISLALHMLVVFGGRNQRPLQVPTRDSLQESVRTTVGDSSSAGGQAQEVANTP
jgi:hypothetical protein